MFVVLALVCTAGHSRANGRFPEAGQIVVSSVDPKMIVARTTFGLLISHDRGATWDWVCESAVGGGFGIQDPMVGITATKSILISAFDGLFVGQSDACDWHSASSVFAAAHPVDVAVRPDDPSSAVVVTSAFASSVDDAGTPGFLSKVYATTNSGADWAPIGVLDPSIAPLTIDIAPSNPHRLYVSATRQIGANVSGLLLVSEDDGAHWVERSVPTIAAEGVFIGAVDPVREGVVYIRTLSTTTSRLLVTTDFGATFREIFHAFTLTGFAISADGSKVYLGGPGGGLNVASRDDYVFREVNRLKVKCLAYAHGELYACSNDASTGQALLLGVSNDDGVTFRPLAHFDSIRGPIACASGSGAKCVSEWPLIRMTLPLGGAPDGGAPNAEVVSDAGASEAPARKASGCTVATNRAGLGSGKLASILAAVAALFLSRIVGRRPCPPPYG